MDHNAKILNFFQNFKGILTVYNKFTFFTNFLSDEKNGTNFLIFTKLFLRKFPFFDEFVMMQQNCMFSERFKTLFTQIYNLNFCILLENI